jgi:hypothetical protein
VESRLDLGTGLIYSKAIIKAEEKGNEGMIDTGSQR